MTLPLFLALSILLAQGDTPAPPQDAGSSASAPAPSDAPPPPATTDSSAAPAGASETEDIPPGAPTDDFGFVSWCYGALDEYLGIYDKVLPDLKDIDKLVGSPVKEDVPYAKDVALEKKALKRFGDAIQAAEKADAGDVDAASQTDIAQGRAIWSKAETMPSRKLADAWLFWGVPIRCETTAKSLHERSVAALGHH
jgi:hypothetical protein